MKILREKIYKNIIYPIFNLKYGPRFGFQVVRELNHIEKLQWLSNDEVLFYQAKKIKALAYHIYNNVPYYRHVMHEMGLRPEDINSIDDFNSFPILTKKEIKANYNNLISKDINKRNVQKSSTGGTTGEPITILRDLTTYVWTKAIQLRGMSWAHYELGDAVIFFTSYDEVSSLGKIRNKFINYHYFPAMANEKELLDIFKELSKLQPFFIMGYSSNLYRILSIWNRLNLNDIQIKAIFTTGEMLYDYQREFINRQFNSKVFDCYGCNEIGSLAYECEYGNKHISNDHVLVQSIDSYGNPLVNKPGEIIITDLDNYAMPLIRYKIGDIGVVNNDRCKCGRGLSIIKNLQGRSQEFLRSEDGNYIAGILFPNRFHDLSGISKFQIIQQDIKDITLRIVINENFLQEELNNMVDFIKKTIGDSVSVKVENVTDIPLTGRGKERIVISHVPVEF